MIHGRGNLSLKEFSFQKLGPFLGDFLIPLFGLEGDSMLVYGNKMAYQCRTESKEYLKHWYENFFGYYRYHLIPETQATAFIIKKHTSIQDFYDGYCFPAVNPLYWIIKSTENAPELYYITVHPIKNLFCISMSKYRRDGDKIRNFKPDPRDPIVHQFGELESRYLAEVNIMRAKFLNCISYDRTQSSANGNQRREEEVENGPANPIVKTGLSNYSKLIEACIIPVHATEMELTFQPVLTNPTPGVTPLEREFNFKKSVYAEEVKDFTGAGPNINNQGEMAKSIRQKKQHSMRNPWNITYLVKSNVIPHHVILEFVNNAIQQWELGYRRLEFNKLTLEDLNCTTYRNLTLSPIKNELWLDKYEYTLQSKIQQAGEDVSLDNFWYCSPLDWNIMSLDTTAQQSIPFCTDVIYNGGMKALGFDTFDILMEEYGQSKLCANISKVNAKAGRSTDNNYIMNTLKMVKNINPKSRVHCWLFQEEDLFLDTLKKHLTNGPFYDYVRVNLAFLKRTEAKRSVFLTFLFSIVFLDIHLSHLRNHVGKNTQVLMSRINDLKHMSWFTVMNGDPDPFFRTNSPKTDNPFGLDVDLTLYTQRSTLYQCHIYSTCFLPLASWFKGRILSRQSIADEHVPLDMLYPWPERNMSWLETPDTRYNLQFVNFWHGNVTIHEDALTTQFQKSLPFPSQGRSIDWKVRDACYKNSSVNAFFFFLIRNTLFGTYGDVFFPACFLEPAHASNRTDSNLRRDDAGGSLLNIYRHVPLSYRPAFGTLLCLYDAFFHPALLAVEERHKDIMQTLLSWGTVDSKMTSTLTKDLLINLMVLQPQYIKLQTTFDWKTVWFRNSIVSNIIRLLVDRKLGNLYEQNCKTFSLADLLPRLPKNIQNSLFSNPSCFLKRTAKYPISAKLYGQFKAHNERLIIDNIKLREEISVMEIHLQDCTQGKEWKEKLAALVLEKRSALRLLEFELGDVRKKEIWVAMAQLAITGNDASDMLLQPETLLQYGVFNFLTEQEINALFVILNHYIRNVNPKQIETIMQNFSVVGFRTMYFVLKVFKMLESFQILNLDEESIQAIDLAMRRKYNILPSRPLPEKAYHIYYAYCCKRICNINETKRNFGNDCVLYNPFTRTYRCAKKKIKKQQIFHLNALVGGIQIKTAKIKAQACLAQRREEREKRREQGEGSMIEPPEIASTSGPLSPSQQAITELTETTLFRLSDRAEPGPQQDLAEAPKCWSDAEGVFRHLLYKSQKKVARAIERQSNLYCLKNPEVLTINMRGKMIIDKKKHDSPKKYLHCSRCGHFHQYNDAYWYGTQYYCSHCWAERELLVVECLHCHTQKAKKMDKLCTVPHQSHHNYDVGSDILKREKEKSRKPKKKDETSERENTAFDLRVDVDMMFDGKIDMDSYNRALIRLPTAGELSGNSASLAAHSRQVMNSLYQNEMLEYNLLQPGVEEWEQSYKRKSSGVGQSYNPDDMQKPLSSLSERKKTGKKKRKAGRKIPAGGNRTTSKAQESKLEETASRYLNREVVMANRTEKKKLTERAQRSLVKHGRILILHSSRIQKLHACMQYAMEVEKENSPICIEVGIHDSDCALHMSWEVGAGPITQKNGIDSPSITISIGDNSLPTIPIFFGTMCELHNGIFRSRMEYKAQFDKPEGYETSTSTQVHFVPPLLLGDISQMLKKPDLAKGKKKY